MTHALYTDVEDRLGRPLNPDEVTQVTEYLKDAESALLRKLPNLITDSATNAVLSQNLKAVEIAITLRAARLTDAVQAVYPNTENWSVPSGSSRANVTVLDSEWRKVGLTWYSSFSLSQNNATLNGGPGPGAYPDLNPTWGPWWCEGSD